MFFFFQAEDGIRDWSVTGVQTCALPIYISQWWADHVSRRPPRIPLEGVRMARKRMFFDGSKAVRELGMPQTPIDRALAEAVEWFRSRCSVFGIGCSVFGPNEPILLPNTQYRTPNTEHRTPDYRGGERQRT